MTGVAHPRVERFDLSGRLSGFERTPSGGLRIPAYISRTGVQVYRDADGREIREYRPPSEVLAEASWRSFEGAPVTRLHPEELVNPLTWREVAIGIVRNVRPDGDRVAADIIVEDAEAIAEIESGDLVETSAGYTAEVADSSGEADGEAYDAVQTEIRGNHVALGPEGWGRAGPAVRLRVDAAHQVISRREARATRQDSMSTKTTVKVDGIPYEAGSESHIQAVEHLVSRLEQERNDAKRRADEMEEELAEAKKELEEAEKATSQEELDSLVSKRLSLIDQARGLLGSKFKWAGKSDAEIMRAALKKAGHAVADDASDDFLAGAFSHAVTSAKKAAKDAEKELEDEDEELLEVEEIVEDEDDEERDDDDEDEGRRDTRRRDGGGFRVSRSRRRMDAAAPEMVRPPFEEKWRR